MNMKGEDISDWNKEKLHDFRRSSDGSGSMSYKDNIIKKYYHDKKLKITTNIDEKADILVIDINKNTANIVNKYGKGFNMIIIKIPRRYDFESFVRRINYNHTDIYKQYGDKVYYCVIKTNKN